MSVSISRSLPPLANSSVTIAIRSSVIHPLKAGSQVSGKIEAWFAKEYGCGGDLPSSGTCFLWVSSRDKPSIRTRAPQGPAEPPNRPTNGDFLFCHLSHSRRLKWLIPDATRTTGGRTDTDDGHYRAPSALGLGRACSRASSRVKGKSLLLCITTRPPAEMINFTG